MFSINIDEKILKVIKAGEYINNRGTTVNFSAEQQQAEANTKLYTPQQLASLVERSRSQTENKPIIEITTETTSVAAHRLIMKEGYSDLALLHFASPCDPEGNSFGWGEAQEADLMSCSGLYSCLLQQPDYYQSNCTCESLMYADNIIYSPQVPWFKTRPRQFKLLDNFFQASVISASAPNAGEISRTMKGESDLDRALTSSKMGDTFRRRVKYILAVAQDNGHRSLLLGAWGCGGLQNNYHNVASNFHTVLSYSEFKDCFDRVIFAIHDRSKKKKILRAFQDKFEYRYLAIDLAKELTIHNPPLPFWLRYPDLDSTSFWGGVRLGFISYRDVWWFWAREKSQSELIEYFRHFAPIPLEWGDWVGNWIFGDDIDDDNDEWEELAVREMAKVGLIDFDRWKEWYSLQWESDEEEK